MEAIIHHYCFTDQSETKGAFTDGRGDQKGTNGRIIMKMNSVTDVDFIQKVSEASNAGVKVDLIVRGICCILPGVKGYTENLRVTSIVGRYLEHPRIFLFGTGADQKIYIGSCRYDDA